MKYVDLKCAECGKSFKKPKKEYNRRIREGRNRFFCSLSCTRYKLNRENPPKGNPESLRGYAGNRRDNFTPFKWFMKRIKRRAKFKKYESNITLEYLQELFESQDRRCTLTGWQLELPVDSDNWEENNHPGIKCASLDRIDNSIGYMKGNVRFISVMANYARNKFTDEEVLEFAEAVIEYNRLRDVA